MKDVVESATRAQPRFGIGEQPPQHRPPVPLPLLRQHVGVDTDDVGEAAQSRTAGQELLHRSHQCRLARSGVADQQDVRRRMSDQMLDHSDGDLADRIILADDGLAQVVGDLLGAEGKGFHQAAIVRVQRLR